VRKLDDQGVEALRSSYFGGQSIAALAAAFGVSERQVRRLVEGIEKPPPAFAVRAGETVETALERFLADTNRDLGDEVRAATARALARRLDRADSRAAPALARALVDVLANLRGETDPDALEQLRRRRATRLLALQTAPNGHTF
jgi:plasmid maintenance system antidote protein VapI